MAKTIHLRLTGESEKLLSELVNLGMTERQVIAKAIGLLSIAHKTGRVALLKPQSVKMKGIGEIVDYVFSMLPVEHILKEESTEEAEASVRSAQFQAMYEQFQRQRQSEEKE
jgi:hypothetical protein